MSALRAERGCAPKRGDDFVAGEAPRLNQLQPKSTSAPQRLHPQSLGFYENQENPTGIELRFGTMGFDFANHCVVNDLRTAKLGTGLLARGLPPVAA